jgi:peptide/nickel transport system substrate-binding protein
MRFMTIFVFVKYTVMTKYLTFISFAIISLLFACKGDINPEDNTVNIRLKKDPERVNPLIFPNPTAREVYQYIHLPLADFDPESLELTPLLIKSIPTEMNIDTGAYKGGIYFDVEILDDAKWDNGSPITAEDYIFTIKAINLPLTNAGKYREITQNITDIIADPGNPTSFRVIFAKDYMLALETAVNVEIYPRYFYDSLNILAKYGFKEINEENEEKLKGDSELVRFADHFNSNDLSRNKMSGAGPYKFVSWTADQSIVLEKKNDYWAKDIKSPALQQGPSKIVFHIIPDELTAVTQLKAGSIDIINEITAESYAELSNDETENKKYNFYHPSLMKHYYISINNQDPKLSDKNVRLALAHLIDVENVIKNLENGMAVRSVGPIHPIKKTYNKTLAPIKFDLDAANKLLNTAGWKDTDNNGIIDKSIGGKKVDMELEILVSSQPLGKKIAIMLQESAAKAGIKIQITEKDFKLIRAENLKTRKYHLVPAVLSQDIIAWDDLSKWHSENDTPDGSNDMSYRSVKTDELIDKIIVTKSDTERIGLYQQIQEQIYQDQPVIFLYSPQEKIIISKKWASSSTVKRPGYMANTFTLAGSSVLSNK